MQVNTASLPSPYWPAGWSVDAFSVVDRMMPEFHPNDTVTKYPLRYLRYWFIRHLLEAHARKLGRPIDVLEVGVDRGQMLAFMAPSPERKIPDMASSWHAVDVKADEAQLLARGYSGYTSFNVDGSAKPPLDRKYDAMIFLHLLEHLHAPEACLEAFLPFLNDDGIMTGGSPTMPKLFADLGYEKRLAKNAGSFGHVSVISPERIEHFADTHGLKVAFLSGSFLARNNGKAIENSAAWLRLNVAFGSLFPSLGSEVYFSLAR